MASGARPRAARAKGRLSEVSRLSVRAQNRVRVARVGNACGAHPALGPLALQDGNRPQLTPRGSGGLRRMRCYPTLVTPPLSPRRTQVM